MFDAVLNKINKDKINHQRLHKCINNKYFILECKLVDKMYDGILYYQRLLDLELDKTNPNNSYIMWILNKVDTIDLNKNIKIVAGQYSLPDIDSDFETEHRDEIIDYIRQKYGDDRVSQIVTFTNIKGKKALTEVFSAFGDVSHEEIKRMTAGIIEEHKITDELQEMEEIEEGSSSIIRWCLENRSKMFAEWCYLDEHGELKGPYADRFALAMHLEGVKAAQSRHAAGVVVSADKVSNNCPMILDTKTQKAIGGLTMNDMEAVGLCKMDILGVTFLDKMAKIKELNPSFNPDFNSLDLDDQDTWELLSSGKTKGVFQLESKLGQTQSKLLKPNNIEQLSGLVAILRPGTMEAELDDGKNVTSHYIKRKNLEEEVEYIHESTKDILEKTYGLLIYQESAMKLAQKIAGFDLKQADVLRKAIGKKKADLMAKVKKEFLDGVKEQKIVSEEIGDTVFSWIEKSQRYSFNKSHSLSYALCSFMSAYAKAHFPKEFYTSYLYYSKEKPKPQEEIYQLINDAKSFDIYVQAPNIKLLNKHFTLIDGQIYFGLSDIKGVGESTIDTLCKYIKPETTWYEFLFHISDKIKSKTIPLINAGACDCFGLSRSRMVFEYNVFTEITGKGELAWIKSLPINDKTNLLDVLVGLSKIPTGRNGGCSSKKRLNVILGLIELLNNPPTDLIDKPHQIAQLENQLLGVCLTATFLDEANAKYKANCTCQEFNDGFNSRNSYISIACQIDKIKLTTTKKGANPGQEMAMLSITDETGISEIVAFPDKWTEYNNLLLEGNRVLITGKRSYNKQEKKLGDSLVIENVEQI